MNLIKLLIRKRDILDKLTSEVDDIENQLQEMQIKHKGKNATIVKIGGHFAHLLMDCDECGCGDSYIVDINDLVESLE